MDLGRSLLGEALSPSGRQVLNEFFQASGSTMNLLSMDPDESAFQSNLPLLTDVKCTSRSAILEALQLQHSAHGVLIVANIKSNHRNTYRKDIDGLENIHLIKKGDVLVSVNQQFVTDVEDAEDLIENEKMPLHLVFSRVVVRKNTLGEYDANDIMRHLEHDSSKLLTKYDLNDAAEMVHVFIDLSNSKDSYQLLREFI